MHAVLVRFTQVLVQLRLFSEQEQSVAELSAAAQTAVFFTARVVESSTTLNRRYSLPFDRSQGRIQHFWF